MNTSETSLNHLLHARAADLSQRLPGAASKKWPEGERFTQALAHGTMSVELYAPAGYDPQTPHTQDELYFIHSGSAQFFYAGEIRPCTAGDCLFVPAGVEHRFLEMSDDFVTWVVFWGPQGGEN